MSVLFPRWGHLKTGGSNGQGSEVKGQSIQLVIMKHYNTIGQATETERGVGSGFGQFKLCN